VTVILHVSDPHFGTEQERVVQALLACARELKPDLVVVSGDITQRARTPQFARAACFVRELGAPHILAIPGNHDVPLFDVVARAVSPYAQYVRFFGPDLEPRFAASDCLVLGVKTTRRYRHVDGEVSSAQCQRVAADLRRASPAQLRLVVVHQPLAVPRTSEQKNVAHGRDQAVSAWADAGADLVLSGHVHLPFVLPLHEAFGLRRPFWAVSAGTAVSSRIRFDAGNSVNVIRTTGPASPRSAIVEQWNYRDTPSAFYRAVEHRLGGA
jgi:3',5'-cyclic AMP phosphodiesterase CpdA